ncbi:MAG: hypothetical protein K2Q32_00100 [Alphaproteobacteria bacterium]|nr:hypothetical protein [Alphaproteobacteria bacterium]
MQNFINQILIVEPRLTVAIGAYINSLLDLDFDHELQTHYRLANTEVDITSYREETIDVLRMFPPVAVFLADKFYDEKSSHDIVPEIFRCAPNCIIYLAGDDVEAQRAAISKLLTDAGLANHVGQLHTHHIDDEGTFCRIINNIVRPDESRSTLAAVQVRL